VAASNRTTATLGRSQSSVKARSDSTALHDRDPGLVQQVLGDVFAQLPGRWCCTATPNSERPVMTTTPEWRDASSVRETQVSPYVGLRNKYHDTIQGAEQQSCR